MAKTKTSNHGLKGQVNNPNGRPKKEETLPIFRRVPKRLHGEIDKLIVEYIANHPPDTST